MSRILFLFCQKLHYFEIYLTDMRIIDCLIRFSAFKENSG